MRRLRSGLAVVALAACGSASSASDTRLPAVQLESLDGGTVELDAIEGPAVINVWATNCAPCVREMPALQSVANDHPNVAFYGLNVAESPSAVSEFVNRLGVEYTQLLDQAGYAAEALGVDSMPTTFVIDADDTIVDRHRGEITAAQLTDAIEDLSADT